MNSKPKDLEIIYNLQWYNNSRLRDHGVYTGTAGIVIGMYDIPETTLNWSTFKSYLLKNSGIGRDLGENIELSYNSGNGLVNIASQREFQIALYDFRRRARMGLVVRLNVYSIPEERIKNSNDVETQYSICWNSHSPPDWFIKYMTEFKKDILEEVTCAVSGIVLNFKPHIPAHIRKPKPERLKKNKKSVPDIDGDQGSNEEHKLSKIEGKLNRKLENLEQRTKKIIEKKLALLNKSSGTEEEVTCSRLKTHAQQKFQKENDMSLLDAAAINKQEIVPHMVGGETYTHKWQVINCGKIPWTEATCLIYTWGSKELLPVSNTIPAPLLKPGETGTISALIRIPCIPGQYECYWHFHHNKYRFGQWLGCQVIVDPFDLRGNKSVLQVTDSTFPYRIISDEHVTFPNLPYPMDKTPYTVKNPQEVVADMKLPSLIDSECSSDDDNLSIISVAESSSSKGLEQDYVLVPKDCHDVKSSQSSTRSTIVDVGTIKKPQSGEKTLEHFDDNNNSEENIQNSKESLHKTDEASSSASCKSDIVMVTLPESCEDTEGFTLIVENGKTVAVPKSMIDEENSRIAEISLELSRREPFIPDTTNYTSLYNRPIPKCLTPEPSTSNYTYMCTRTLPSSLLSPDPSITDSMPNLEPNNDLSHCSATGSCFSEINIAAKNNKRMFMFPEDCPGFELVNSEDKPAEVKSTVEKYEKVCWFPGNGPVYEVATSDPLNHPGCLFSAPVTKLPNRSVAFNLFDGMQNNSEHPEEQSLPIDVTTIYETPSLTPELDMNAEYIRAIAKQLPELPPATFGTRREPIPESNITTATDSIATAGINDADTFGTRREHIPESNTNTVTESYPPAWEIDNVNEASAESERQSTDVPTVNILPETLVNGAVSVASTAFHTARSVINMIVPQEIPNLPNNDVPQQPGQWINGHWVSTNPATPREANLAALAEMGFWNRDMNATLLARYNDDLSRVVAELVQ